MKWTVHILFLIFTTITSCQIIPKETFSELSRDYSSDSSKYILKYNYAQGAWDGGRIWLFTIVHAKDTFQREKHHPYSSLDVDNIYWKGSDTVLIEESFTEYLSNGKSLLKDTIMSAVKIKIIQKDPIDEFYKRKIIYQEISPNKQYNLIAYRYVKPENGHYFLNISIVNINDSIPKFGNFYVSKFGFDCFEDIRWDKTNELDIKVSESCYYAFEGYLIKNKVPIKYKVRIDNDFDSKGNIKH